VIVPGFIEIEVAARIQLLARVLVGHIHGGGRDTLIREEVAIREIGDRLHRGPRTVGDHTAGPQMIPMPVSDRAAAGDRSNPLGAGKSVTTHVRHQIQDYSDEEQKPNNYCQTNPTRHYCIASCNISPKQHFDESL